MKIAFLVNGLTSNKQRIIQEIVKQFADFSIDFFVSKHKMHLVDLTKNALSKGYTTLGVIGGDGSINEVVNGLISFYQTDAGYDWKKIFNVKLFVLPEGSGNDFSRVLYHDYSLEKAVQLLKADCFQPVDVGQARFTNFDKQAESRFFINITDIGLGGDVVKKKNTIFRWLPSSIGYNVSILATFLGFSKKQVTATFNSQNWTKKIMSLVVANGRYFGAGLCVAPNASISDGQFSVIKIGDISLIDYIKHLPHLKNERQIVHPEVTYDSVTNITLVTAKPLPIDMDGECVGATPLSISCLHQRLQFLCEIN